MIIQEAYGFKPGNSATARSIGYEKEVAPSLSTSESCGGGAWSLDEKMGQTYIFLDVANTLAARDYKQPQAVIYDRTNHGNRPSERRNHEGGCTTLTDNHEQPILMSDRKGHNGITEDGTATTLTAEEKARPLTATTVVRRLTPVECERLQGMPDNWSKYGVNEKGEVYELPDSARYKLQGNGIATPFWRWLLKRISAQYERTPTMGSLFDGQASFPMIWESINGKGTALWSSEIEKHAISVAKYHFPEE